jgi:hypothetical protein
MEIGHADKRGAPEFEIDGHRVNPGVRPSRTCRFLSEVRVELLADLHHVQAAISPTSEGQGPPKW